jgi:galactofuranosylgalactofuranosylrhamnosyl-N-acetylglucosaminyl-diphospho-decaprenol beta-1,5/1,6-galactofuranosyltransferase
LHLQKRGLSNFRYPKLKLVPNINAGGSGGFTRGLVEALDENIYSHFLLMDDDIELESQCIYRLFSLHEYANIDFAVAGGLLNLQKKHMLYEAGATYNKDSKTRGFAPGSLTGVNNNIDLRSSSSLNKLLVEEHIDYGGFWFFSFSKEVVKEIKLPLPLFIKIDDVEFSLRIKELGNKIVAFPSIAVWHQPASTKNLNWETYYLIRNDLITYAIHYSIEYMDTVQHFTKVILESLSRFDYNHVEMVIKSFEDYIKGPDFIKTAEPEPFHVNIIKLSKSYNNQNEIDELAGINLLTRWFKVAADSSSEWSSVSKEWKRASKELTSTIFWQQYLGLKN